MRLETSQLTVGLAALAAEYGKEAVEHAEDVVKSLHRAEQWRAQRVAWAREDRRN